MKFNLVNFSEPLRSIRPENPRNLVRCRTLRELSHARCEFLSDIFNIIKGMLGQPENPRAVVS